MAEQREEEAPPAISPKNLQSDSDKYPAETQSSTEKKRHSEEEAEDTVRESTTKKRRKCPAALDNFEEFESSNRSFSSFSFDTRRGGTPETTPKFGSFNLAGELGLLRTHTQTEDFDLLGFSETNEEQEAAEREKKKNKEIEGSIPIVVKTAD